MMQDLPFQSEVLCVLPHGAELGPEQGRAEKSHGVPARGDLATPLWGGRGESVRVPAAEGQQDRWGHWWGVTHCRGLGWLHTCMLGGRSVFLSQNANMAGIHQPPNCPVLP